MSKRISPNKPLNPDWLWKLAIYGIGVGISERTLYISINQLFQLHPATTADLLCEALRENFTYELSLNENARPVRFELRQLLDQRTYRPSYRHLLRRRS